jgi:hypothetical protein
LEATAAAIKETSAMLLKTLRRRSLIETLLMWSLRAWPKWGIV